MTCRRCGSQSALIKAHVIPEAFFRVLRDETGDVPNIYSDGFHYPRRSPVDVYDKGILCRKYEDKFGALDSYGTEVLIRNLDQLSLPLVADGEVVAYFSNGVDQHRLKLFILSVLWRASVSSHLFYGRIRLGEHEHRLLQTLDRGECSDPDDYSVLMSRWVVSAQNASLVNGVMAPFRERWEGVNAVRLYLGKVVAYIKVDKRRFPAFLRIASLGVQPRAVQIARGFDESKDFAFMKNMARASLRVA